MAVNPINATTPSVTNGRSSAGRHQRRKRPGQGFGFVLGLEMVAVVSSLNRQAVDERSAVLRKAVSPQTKRPASWKSSMLPSHSSLPFPAETPNGALATKLYFGRETDPLESDAGPATATALRGTDDKGLPYRLSSV